MRRVWRAFVRKQNGDFKMNRMLERTSMYAMYVGPLLFAYLIYCSVYTYNYN
jgi:hypothetical protein